MAMCTGTSGEFLPKCCHMWNVKSRCHRDSILLICAAILRASAKKCLTGTNCSSRVPVDFSFFTEA